MHQLQGMCLSRVSAVCDEITWQFDGNTTRQSNTRSTGFAKVLAFVSEAADLSKVMYPELSDRNASARTGFILPGVGSLQ